MLDFINSLLLRVVDVTFWAAHVNEHYESGQKAAVVFKYLVKQEGLLNSTGCYGWLVLVEILLQCLKT